jgi:thymidylate kinase
MKSNSKVSELLSAFFDMLNGAGVRYCVMNNYEDMPEIIPTDVDIAIETIGFNKLDSYVRRFSEEKGVAITQKIWHGYNKCAYILSPLVIDERFRLQLDFFTDFSAKGYPCLIRSEDILKQRQPFKGFFIPAPVVEAPFLFMRRVIKDDLNSGHVKKLRALIEKDKGAVERQLAIIFSGKVASVTRHMIENGDVGILRNNLGSFRLALKRWARRNSTISYRARYGLSQMRRAVYRLSHPVGLSVAFLGPDGSGKSTIAKLVMERVSGSFHGGRIQYWRPHLLPSMGRLKFWNPAKESETNPHPHAHSKQNPGKSLLRFFYYLADYLLGYPVKVYWPKVRKQIIVFDRYYYDYLIDLHRYRFNLPSRLPHVFLPIIPAPDLTIYLHAEPEELLKRKQELPLAELEKQVEQFKKIVHEIPNAITISTNKPIEDTVQEISSAILGKKAAQTRSILSET